MADAPGEAERAALHREQTRRREAFRRGVLLPAVRPNPQYRRQVREGWQAKIDWLRDLKRQG